MRTKRKVCTNCNLVQSRDNERCYHCNSSLRNIIEIVTWPYPTRKQRIKYEAP